MKKLVLTASLLVLGGCTISQTPKSDMYTTNPSNQSPKINQELTITPVSTTTESDEDLLNQLNQDSSEPDLTSQFSDMEAELEQ